MQILATRLRETRELRGLSHEALAKSPGVPGRQSLINIELHGQVPLADKLAAIARALGVSADYLLGLTDDPGGRVEVSEEDARRILAAADEAREAVAPSRRTERRRHSRRAGDPPPL